MVEECPARGLYRQTFLWMPQLHWSIVMIVAGAPSSRKSASKGLFSRVGWRGLSLLFKNMVIWHGFLGGLVVVEGIWGLPPRARGCGEAPRSFDGTLMARYLVECEYLHSCSYRNLLHKLKKK